MAKEKKRLSEEERKKRRQAFLALGLLTCAVGGFTLFHLHLFARKNVKKTASFEALAPPALGSSFASDKELRLVKIEDALESHKKTLQGLMTHQAKVETDIENLSSAQKIHASELKTQLTKTVDLSLTALRKDLEYLFLKKEAPSEPPTVMISAQSLPLSEVKQHVSFVIPAGAVLPCVIVSGSDCSSGISNLSDPEMILLRPLGKARLPKGVFVNIQDSIILARAVGNLSKERVRIRAERMTLVKPNGEFVSTTISGYVTGEDGREGVRGVVVDRSTQMITRASFASFFQGLAGGFQAAKNAQHLAGIKALTKRSQTPFVFNGDLLKESSHRGLGTGMQKLADYWIKRAEQLQPSIQVAAGRKVDLIFTSDVTIGEKNIKELLAAERRRAKTKRDQKKALENHQGASK